MNEKYKLFTVRELEALSVALAEYFAESDNPVFSSLFVEISQERQARHNTRSFTTTSDERTEQMTEPTVNDLINISPDGSWGAENEEVNSSARCAVEHLVDALEEMYKPHDQAEGCAVLEHLLDAQNSIHSAIMHYYDESARFE